MQLVQYFSEAMFFASEITKAIPIVTQLLGSKTSSDILEALQFVATAVQFGIDGAEVHNSLAFFD